MIADAAGDDPVEMRQIRLDVEADAVEGHPAAELDAYGGDLVFPRRRARRLAFDPDADPALPGLALQAEGVERINDPSLQRPNEASRVTAALPQVSVAPALPAVLPGP